MVGDEFAVRYVPQSRYFQVQELGITGLSLNHAQVDQLNEKRALTVVRSVTLENGVTRADVSSGSLQSDVLITNQ
jgi:hypothetical protein